MCYPDQIGTYVSPAESLLQREKAGGDARIVYKVAKVPFLNRHVFSGWYY